MSEFPDQVDCIIIGTSLINSIVAAACSRIGKTIVHFDSNSYYGENWASFTFEQFIEWLRRNHPTNEALESIPESLIKLSRHFCIDLCPNLLYTNGKMVELLVNSNVSRYHEFSNTVNIYSTNEEKQFVLVPFKRVDVFTSPIMSNLMDKRRLTKFIEFVMTYNEEDISKTHPDLVSNFETPISDYLTKIGFNKTLTDIIINSVAMIEPQDSTQSACRSIKKFMIAVQRFGKSPFLFPIYGSGEFAQSFCRLSAVYGGTYCLNKAIKSLDKQDGLLSVHYENCDNHNIRCNNVLIDLSEAIKLNVIKQDEKFVIQRAIVISKESVFKEVKSTNPTISFTRVPKDIFENTDIIHLLEVSSTLMVAPADHFITYLWTRSSEDSLRKVMNHYHGDNAIWKVLYEQKVLDKDLISHKDLLFSSSCNDNLDYDEAVTEARKIFENIYPDEEFLPRAPDPDELHV